MKQTHFTPELWEQRFYEVAKAVLIEKLGTSSHCDSGRALDEEIEESIEVAHTFIDKFKEVSEFRMGCGVWGGLIMPRIGDKIMRDYMREDIRGYCNRDCIYCDNGRCDMWDDFAMPEDVNKCDNYTENF